MYAVTPKSKQLYAITPSGVQLHAGNLPTFVHRMHLGPPKETNHTVEYASAICQCNALNTKLYGLST